MVTQFGLQTFCEIEGKRCDINGSGGVIVYRILVITIYCRSSHLPCVCEDGSPTHCKPALIPATKPLHKKSPQQISSFPSYKLGLNTKTDLSPKEVNSFTLSQSHMSDTVSSFPATDTASNTLMTPTKPASCISSISSGEEVNETCSFMEMATTKKKHCGEEIGEEHSDKGGDGAGHVDVLRGARKEDATSDSSGELQLG